MNGLQTDGKTDDVQEAISKAYVLSAQICPPKNPTNCSFSFNNMSVNHNFYYIRKRIIVLKSPDLYNNLI